LLVEPTYCTKPTLSIGWLNLLTAHYQTFPLVSRLNILTAHFNPLHWLVEPTYCTLSTLSIGWLVGIHTTNCFHWLVGPTYCTLPPLSTGLLNQLIAYYQRFLLVGWTYLLHTTNPIYWLVGPTYCTLLTLSIGWLNLLTANCQPFLLAGWTYLLHTTNPFYWLVEPTYCTLQTLSIGWLNQFTAVPSWVNFRPLCSTSVFTFLLSNSASYFYPFFLVPISLFFAYEILRIRLFPACVLFSCFCHLSSVIVSNTCDFFSHFPVSYSVPVSYGALIHASVCYEFFFRFLSATYCSSLNCPLL
jgi:hypothetical protein